MRVLLLHPEDSPRRGPWSRKRWDLIVDLGNSSEFSEREWSELTRSRVLRTSSFREGVRDVKRVREIFCAGKGRLRDEKGIDWWELLSLCVVSEMLTLLALRRLSLEMPSGAEFWATRHDWRSDALAAICDGEARNFGGGRLASVVARATHYAELTRRFSAAQIREIFLDKYDAAYRWQSRLAREVTPATEPVVLVPSAYGNVSRTAAQYARMLPRQQFLMIATRESAKRFTAPANVQVRDLASYAKQASPQKEITAMLERWRRLRADLASSVELRMLLETGAMEPFSAWIRDGLCLRNAWQRVLEREPVCGVLCGDDSNFYTSLPVLLAAQKNIPAVDFHHGALDGLYLLKDFACDLYLAKNEMERDYLTRVCELPAEKIAIAAPARESARAQGSCEKTDGARKGTDVVYFSEPYEAAGMRGEEVYREILPRLARVARARGCGVIVKLHPFESRKDRENLVRAVLPGEDGARVIVIDGPLTKDLLARAWFGITVESTTVMDCIEQGIPCFVCGWLVFSSYEYSKQYARFGVGEMLNSAEEIAQIPERMAQLGGRPAPVRGAVEADPALLQRWLTCGVEESCQTKSAS